VPVFISRRVLFIKCKQKYAVSHTALACYKLDKHQPILKIFGRNVTEKAGSQTVIFLFFQKIIDVKLFRCFYIFGVQEPDAEIIVII